MVQSSASDVVRNFQPAIVLNPKQLIGVLLAAEFCIRNDDASIPIKDANAGRQKVDRRQNSAGLAQPTAHRKTKIQRFGEMGQQMTQVMPLMIRQRAPSLVQLNRKQL